jgi:PAS domain S-box-containing protein
MKDIVVIAPFSSMYAIAHRVVLENEYINVEILEGNLGDGVKAARLAIEQGAKILISRGGTYEMIKSAVDLPVIEIKVTAFDLIDSFREVKKLGNCGTVGVLGFRSVISGAECIAEVMGLKTLCTEITSESDIAAEIENQVQEGIRVIVGDKNAQAVLARPDCKAVLINSGSQAMQIAIQQAKDILYAARQQREKAQQFASIIDFVHDGIVAIDRQGLITVFNSASEKITGFTRQEAVGRRITDIIPDTGLLRPLETAIPEIGDIQRLENQTIVATNRVPVVVDGEVWGAVATYQDITELQNLEQAIRIRLSEKGFVAQYNFSDIVHKSNKIKECIKTARKFANYDTSVLICGPSGVGKELFAQSIHNSSKHKNSPFVAINCAALPETLIESELFGYVEGSFTGAAKKGKPGLFEMAHGGTIFLDEISELPILLQGRLLRVLQEKQIMRIGDNKMIPVDVRIITATNRNLRSLVRLNQFRGDLYFRIAILSLDIPPLNERADDIELLSAHFVQEFGYKYRNCRMKLDRSAIEFLRGFMYEGNVRELQGMIERAVVICEGQVIGVDDLDVIRAEDEGNRMDCNHMSFTEGLTLKDIENKYIEYVYRKTNGSIKDSSSLLGVDRSTLWRRIKAMHFPIIR